MPRVYVSIGSNIDRETNIRGGLRCLQARYRELTISPLYESQAVGFAGPAFYNLVVAFDTLEALNPLCDALRGIEDHHGRRRTADGFGSRTLDLDLLLYGDLVRAEPPRLPRPEIHEYAFVLRPLADIAPAARHPQTGARYADMWRAFDDTAQPLRRVDYDLAPSTALGGHR